MKYFQAFEKRMAKKCAKDEDFAKASGSLKLSGCLFCANTPIS
ncbi:hypothetical protein MCC93_07510 [Morococcus cerebrosus]|uniref:Uncharacterized protein n=1 Tax=Morococcus cerebrosus TaxID=1056807 RepID=A0A0C1GVE8_9NEIS|nr:hypothetical protein MCC93_07510 [Morococcus cerebrosus]